MILLLVLCLATGYLIMSFRPEIEMMVGPILDKSVEQVTNYCTYSRTENWGDVEVDVYDCGAKGERIWDVAEGNWQ